MKRAAIIGGLMLLVIGSAILLWPYSGLAPRRRLAVENYAQIRVGISQAEVEALLGGPPGNYGRYANGRMTLEGFSGPRGAVERVWCDDANRFEIYFDAEGRVVAHHRRAGYDQSPDEGILAWLRRVTGL